MLLGIVAILCVLYLAHMVDQKIEALDKRIKKLEGK